MSMKRTFKFEIDCANCAAKVESAINKIDGVNQARVNFMTKKLILDAEDDKFESVLKQAQEVAKKVDSDAEIYV